MQSQQPLHGFQATMGSVNRPHPPMREKRLTSEPPNVTEDIFEDILASDDLLVDYFNEFLSLPAFSELIRFNRIFGIFEVLNDAPGRLKEQMKKLLREQQPPNPIYDVTRHVTTTEPPKKKISPDALNIDNNYSVMCLNREQGIQWIMKERLASFLKSDCYFEYRLAKLMSQVKLSNAGTALYIDPRYQPWLVKKVLPQPRAEVDEKDDLMKKFYVSFGQALPTQTKEWFTLAKQSQLTGSTDSSTRPLTSSSLVLAGPSSSSINTSIPAETQSQEKSIYSDPPVPRRHRIKRCPTEQSLSTIVASWRISDRHLKQETGSGYVQRLSGSLVNGIYTPRASGVNKPSDRLQGAKREYAASFASCPPPSPSRVYMELTCDEEMDETRVPIFPTIEDFVAFYIDLMIRGVVATLTGQPPVIKDGVDIRTLSKVIIEHLPSSASSTASFSSSEVDGEEDSMSSDSEVEVACSRVAGNNTNGTYNIRSRKQFEKFKTFLKGTLGENHWLLWLDIERLKALKDIRRQVSHINRMKTLYLVTNGDHFLKTEILSKLNLLDASQWNLPYLTSVQTEIVKPLLLYWGPRFCVAPSVLAEGVTAQLKLWQDRHLRPKRDVFPFPQTVTLLPLRAKSCLPRLSASPSQRIDTIQTKYSATNNGVDVPAKTPARILSAKLSGVKSPMRTHTSASHTTSGPLIAWTRPASVSSYTSQTAVLHGRVSPIVEPKQEIPDNRLDLLLCECTLDRAVPGGSKLENMLQALHLDSRAGYYFTHFCEQSGNEMWKNSAYFWFDLQAYHHLFYHETLHPFRLKRHAQLLFATYLAPAAVWDIGVEQCVKREIYQKLEPPFEDLFDLAEEYILTILLIPWIQMKDSDKSIFEKVELVEETRQLDSVYFRKLQALQQENASKKDEARPPVAPFLPPPDVPKEPNLWEQVPEEYRNYNLSFLIRHRVELEHFRTFLDDHYASMDLMCWIDIEQFRRMPYKEREKREEKSKDIKNKYLNKKYFFGPNSPASREQQEQVMQLGGGWGQILQDRLASAILLEIQKYVRMRIERKWLPLFLATEEYRERQKVQAHMRDVSEDVIVQTQKKKLGVYKHLDSKWIASSKEIIEFRKALLNPVTMVQFQRFISLKGDFLENDLLFWLEVQKYKDLCHSHCDDATIQGKITAIINCFINSSIPPAVQIDITTEQAENILERRRDLGPYVFREAQMEIFSILFGFWPEFCEFRSNITDENLPASDRKRDKVDKLHRLKKGKEKENEKERERERERGREKEREKSDKLQAMLGKRGSLSALYGDNESMYSGATPKQVSWSYSKYIEALEQERMLLKIKEDLQGKFVPSIASADSASVLSVNLEASGSAAKSVRSTSATSKKS